MVSPLILRPPPILLSLPISPADVTDSSWAVNSRAQVISGHHSRASSKHAFVYSGCHVHEVKRHHCSRLKGHKRR
ncbi:hypothetical protein OROMI_024594 [Orobanche minor]